DDNSDDDDESFSEKENANLRMFLIPFPFTIPIAKKSPTIPFFDNSELEQEFRKRVNLLDSLVYGSQKMQREMLSIIWYDLTMKQLGMKDLIQLCKNNL